MAKVLKGYFTGLTRNTFLLALASFFSDSATEMLHPVLPIFLTQVLAAPATVVGLVEGVAEGTQNIIQGFSGWIADKTQKRKKLALLGYGLAAVSKPFIGIAVSWPQVLIARFSDRFGTGIRSAPRDALIAASADDAHRGKAFGLEGAGDNLGAVMGPLLAVFLIFSLKIDLRLIFYLAFIPAVISFLMILFVSEKSNQTYQQQKTKIKFGNFPKQFWLYLFIVGLFGIGNSSNAFLILRTKEIGIGTELTILIYAAFNFVAAAVSLPAGTLSDKLGRKNILILALIIFTLTYLGFATSKNLHLVAFLFIFYGVYQGIARAVGKAMAADLTPPQMRATGIGLYSTVIGLTTFAASLVGGTLWDKINPSATFFYGAFFATLACLILVFLPLKTPIFKKSG